jgi:hypothetical protein
MDDGVVVVPSVSIDYRNLLYESKGFPGAVLPCGQRHVLSLKEITRLSVVSLKKAIKKVSMSQKNVKAY